MKRAGKVCGDPQDLKSPGIDKYETLIYQSAKNHRIFLHFLERSCRYRYSSD